MRRPTFWKSTCRRSFFSQLPSARCNSIIRRGALRRRVTMQLLDTDEDPVVEAAVAHALRLVAGSASPALLQELRKSIRLHLATDPRARALVQRLRGRPVQIRSGANPAGEALDDADDEAKTVG